MKPCPRCDAATKVNGTKTIGDTIVRHRVCLNPECGVTFKTTQSMEQCVLEDFIPPADARAGK